MFLFCPQIGISSHSYSIDDKCMLRVVKKAGELVRASVRAYMRASVRSCKI